MYTLQFLFMIEFRMRLLIFGNELGTVELYKAARDNIYASKESPYSYHIYFSDIYLMLTATDVSMSPLCLLVRYENMPNEIVKP